MGIKTKTVGELNGLGWIQSNNEANEQVIQRDDEMEVFKSDQEAVEFVVKSYSKLLEALKTAKLLLEDCKLELHTERYNNVEEWLSVIVNAINEAEKYKKNDNSDNE